MRTAYLRPLIGAVLLVPTMFRCAGAAPGDLDPTFGTPGQGIALSTVGDQGAVATTLQADGKILTATLAEAGADRATLRVTRFTTSGVVDPVFGTAGTASVSLAVDKMSVVRALLRQAADDKIVVGGRSIDAFAVTRLTAAGAIDSGFGTAGTATTTVLGDDEVFALAQQADGKVLAVGRADDGRGSDFAIVRYTATGQPDPTFSGDGIQTVDLGGDDAALAVAIQDDGAIVLAGVSTGNSANIALARLTSTGALDAGFGTGGKVTTSVSTGDDSAWAVLVQPNGKIAVAGEADDDFVLVRYTSAGQVDTGFASAGIARTNVSAGARDFARALVRQGDGKYVAAGSAILARATDFALVRYTTGGVPDATFGNGGVVTTSVSATFNDELATLVSQADGKIVAAGRSEDGETTWQMLARYETGVSSSVCGNGAVESPEQCDLGASNGTGGACCTANCTFSSTVTVCRAAAGSCDVAETCTGTSGTCPSNAFAGSTTTCRAAAGTCDVAEKCTGTSATCPSNAFAATTVVCRASAGVCDAAERCSGTGATCPVDVPASAGTSCNEDGNPCTDNTCNGSGTCVTADNSVPCDDGDICTLTDVCSGGACTGSGSVCGNGSSEPSCGEECDDGNLSNTDACVAGCQSAACGDGYVRTGVEGCDDGNATAGDGCSATCQIETCGNGTVEGLEACDDGNADNTDACLNTCAAASCGDGFVHAGIEECDDGNDTNADACVASCQAAACGDGYVQAGEEACDDGNTADGDLCSADCQTAIECGDADRNGKVQASDALRVLRKAVGQAVACEPELCDVNSNGSVQASDALNVLRAAVGQPVTLECPAAAA